MVDRTYEPTDPGRPRFGSDIEPILAEYRPDRTYNHLHSSKAVPARSGVSSRPQTRRKSAVAKCKRNPEVAAAPTKSRKATVEEVEDEDDLSKATQTESEDDHPKPTEFKNPIYFSDDVVPKNKEGSVGKPGDKHYRCRHGNGRIITITKAMRYSVSGLTTHLKKDFPAMYRLYQFFLGSKYTRPSQNLECLI
ncbi:hypothetical protein C8R44DRAFT_869148 [Mycena epipterygia]|nr:hypothetical protein C8R44DRAFT_869148 [Mycena epipterygia]